MTKEQFRACLVAASAAARARQEDEDRRIIAETAAHAPCPGCGRGSTPRQREAARARLLTTLGVDELRALLAEAEAA